MAKLTDRQHKRMIAMYAECQNYSLVAKKFGVSVTTVRRHCIGDTETTKKVNQKKAENTAEILAHMGAQKDRVCDILDLYLTALGDPSRISGASLVQVATAMGILVDKYAAGEKPDTAASKENNLLEAISEATKGGVTRDDIPELLEASAADDDMVESS